MSLTLVTTRNQQPKLWTEFVIPFRTLFGAGNFLVHFSFSSLEIEQRSSQGLYSPRSANCLLLFLPEVEEWSLLLLLPVQIVDGSCVWSGAALLHLWEMGAEGVGDSQSVEGGITGAAGQRLYWTWSRGINNAELSWFESLLTRFRDRHGGSGHRAR